MKVSRGLLAVVLVALAVPAGAQSLGELAKKEAERRKAQPTVKKVYTDDDLKKITVPGGTAPAPEPAAKAGDATTPAGDATADAAKTAATDKAEEKDKPAGEAEWRGKMTTARENLRRSEMFAEALQSRINALTTDFTARDDPYQRAQIADDRQKALAELEQVKKDIVNGKKAINDIEEEARRANVPPGWIR